MNCNEGWATFLVLVVGHETLKAAVDMAYISLDADLKAVWTCRQQVD